MSLATWLLRRKRALLLEPEPVSRGRTWIWVLDDSASDIGGPPGPSFRKKLLLYPEEIGTFHVNVPAESAREGHFFSPPNQPGHSEWPVGPWRVKTFIAAAPADMELAIGLDRVDGTGAFIQAYATVSAQQGIAGGGARTFSGTTLAQTVSPLPTTGHRVRVVFYFENFGLSNAGVDLGFGDDERDTVEVPILMGNPAIVWNGNVLTFPGPLTRYDLNVEGDSELEFSAGRVAAGLLHSMGDLLEIELADFDDAQFEADLGAWWSWASQKKQYAFAFDAADVVDLVLNGGAAAGQKDIPLANTSSVVVGRKYLLREAAGPEEEVVQVDSIVTNVKAVALNNLKYGYLTGDRLRSRDYFPKMVSLDNERPWRLHFTTWSLLHRMAEDRG
jgi:hypothetical protein